MTQNKRQRYNNNKSRDEFDHRVVDLARVVRVVAGGRRFRFRAAVVVGDRRGRVGLGVAKGADVAGAVDKAIKQGRKHLINAKEYKGTIPHEVAVKYKSAYVLLRPATEGRGLIAGGAIRNVIELAGIRNIVSKSLGSNNKIAIVGATLKGLANMESQADVMARRGIRIKNKKAVKGEGRK